MLEHALGANDPIFWIVQAATISSLYWEGCCLACPLPFMICWAGRDSTACRPVLFLKPPSAAVFASAQNVQVTLELVKGKGSVHYEAEVVLRLNEALEVDAVTLGLDLTLRDLQAQLKKNGHPWEISKVQYLKCPPANIACL